MAKNPTDFAQQNTERAVQATNYGMNWMREIAEQNLNQSKAALEGLLMITRKAVDDIDHQASVVRERSLLLAEETLSNTFDFAQKLVRMREPQDSEVGSYEGTAGIGSTSERVRQAASSGTWRSNQRAWAKHDAGSK